MTTISASRIKSFPKTIKNFQSRAVKFSTKNPVSKAIKNRVINDKNYWQGRFPRLINNSWKRYVGFRFTKDACESTAGILTLKTGMGAAVSGANAFANSSAGQFLSGVSMVVQDSFVNCKERILSTFQNHLAPSLSNAATEAHTKLKPVINDISTGNSAQLNEHVAELGGQIGSFGKDKALESIRFSWDKVWQTQGWLIGRGDNEKNIIGIAVYNTFPAWLQKFMIFKPKGL